MWQKDSFIRIKNMREWRKSWAEVLHGVEFLSV